jgi:hypothetical protein
MSKISIELSENTVTALEREANRLEISLDSLVEGLIRKFLQKQGLMPEEEERKNERRHSPREKFTQSAVLYFKTNDGLYGLYRSGDLKNLALDSALVECETDVGNSDPFRAGTEFDLIFQLKEEQQPLRIMCKVRRVTRAVSKIRMGVSFLQQDDETRKILLEYLKNR